MFLGVNCRVVAVDCDGTLCSNMFPEMGEPNYTVIDYVKTCRANGDKLILFTCRNGEDLKSAVNWCRRYGLEFDAVNSDIPDIANTQFGRNKSSKIYYDELIDDKATNSNDVQINPGETQQNRMSGLLSYIGK